MSIVAGREVKTIPERPSLIRGRVRGRVMFMLCTLYALSYIDRVNLSVAAPFIQSELALTNTQLGLVLSAFTLPYAFLQVFGGWIGDKYGGRRILTVLVVIWSVATIATGAAQSLGFLIAARLLLGVGESAAFPTATSVMATWLPRTLRGAGQAWVHAASRIANSLTPIIVAALIVWVGWRTGFIILGVITLTWSIIWYTWFRDNPSTHRSVKTSELNELRNGGAAAESKPKVANRTLIRLLAPALLPVLFVDFCYGWLLWVYLTWLPTLFSSSFGLELKAFAGYSSIVLAAGAIGNIVGGRWADMLVIRRNLRTARRIPLVTGLLGSLIVLVFAFVFGSLAATVISLAVAFFFLELTNSTLWAIPMDIAPEHAGFASGFMNTGFGLAGIASVNVFGILLDWSDNYLVPLGLSMIILGLGAAAAFLINPTKRELPVH